jgi:hypothetical protein
MKEPSGSSERNGFHFTFVRTWSKRETETLNFISSSHAMAILRVGWADPKTMQFMCLWRAWRLSLRKWPFLPLYSEVDDFSNLSALIVDAQAGMRNGLRGMLSQIGLREIEDAAAAKKGKRGQAKGKRGQRREKGPGSN